MFKCPANLATIVLRVGDDGPRLASGALICSVCILALALVSVGAMPHTRTKEGNIRQTERALRLGLAPSQWSSDTRVRLPTVFANDAKAFVEAKGAHAIRAAQLGDSCPRGKHSLRTTSKAAFDENLIGGIELQRDMRSNNRAIKARHNVSQRQLAWAAGSSVDGAYTGSASASSNISPQGDEPQGNLSSVEVEWAASWWKEIDDDDDYCIDREVCANTRSPRGDDFNSPKETNEESSILSEVCANTCSPLGDDYKPLSPPTALHLTASRVRTYDWNELIDTDEDIPSGTARTPEPAQEPIAIGAAASVATVNAKEFVPKCAKGDTEHQPLPGYPSLCISDLGRMFTLSFVFVLVSKKEITLPGVSFWLAISVSMPTAPSGGHRFIRPYPSALTFSRLKICRAKRVPILSVSSSL